MIHAIVVIKTRLFKYYQRLVISPLRNDFKVNIPEDTVFKAVAKGLQTDYKI